MPACLQKTLLLYAPLLLAIAINAVWSRDPAANGQHAVHHSHHTPPHDEEEAVAAASSVESIAGSAEELLLSSGISGEDGGDEPQTTPVHHGHNNNNGQKPRRNRKMVNRYGKHHQHHGRHENQSDKDLALWINEQQMKILSGYPMKVYAIDKGQISDYVMDPNIKHLIPTIPSEVNSVNFTWRSGTRKYYYNFDRLQSLDENILRPPTVSIKKEGRVPTEPREFNVGLPCAANASGTAMFSIGLLINTSRGRPVPGTPIRLSFKKECAPRAPDPECDKKCANHGWCNKDKICQCPQGYMGQHCQQGLCFPQCMHGGNCTAPGKCSCPPGYQGGHCEGGICTKNCLNGGKCYQKDKCHCPKGYYGLRCEYSKCVIPCMNGGKCVGNNTCRCPVNYGGKHCEILSAQRSSAFECRKPCPHGQCMADGKCKCQAGWFGRNCNQRGDKHRKNTLH